MSKTGPVINLSLIHIFYGVYYSDSADFAEAYETAEPMAPGELAVLWEDLSLIHI